MWRDYFAWCYRLRLVLASGLLMGNTEIRFYNISTESQSCCLEQAIKSLGTSKSLDSFQTSVNKQDVSIYGL